ncbi:MAG: hypothetical protein U0176_14035 [Bacteroidia bacterium]
METPDIGQGFIKLETPCSVPWQSMEPREGGNRFCQSCSKVVHNISAMSPEEIIALLRTDPGNICVNYVQFHFPPDTAKKQPRIDSKPVRKRNIRFAAAAASLLLLAQQGQTSAPFRPKTHLSDTNPKTPDDFLPTNTLVSGNVLTTRGDLIPHDVEVTIYKDHRELARVMTRAGLFFLDLKGLAEPSDTITLSIQPGPLLSSSTAQVDSSTNCAEEGTLVTNPNPPEFYPWTSSFYPTFLNGYDSDHKGIIKEIVLAEAQNIELKVEWTFHYYPVMSYGGAPITILGSDYPWILPTAYCLVVAEQIPSEGPTDSQDYSCTDFGRP